MTEDQNNNAFAGAPEIYGPYERRASDIVTRQVVKDGEIVYERVDKTSNPTSTMGSLYDWDAIEKRERKCVRSRIRRKTANTNKKGKK